MDVMCSDNRFEIIDRAKKHLLEATNIDTSEDEMKVLDNFLFRCWQMGWLDRYDEQAETHEICTETHACVKAEPKYGEWMPCSERLPDACKEVLLTCEVRPINHKPFRYVCTAQWIPKFCKEAISIDWDEEATEYCEEDDEFYPHEGWYESISNWEDYSLVGIGDFAIAWKPLPEPWKGADDE